MITSYWLITIKEKNKLKEGLRKTLEAAYRHIYTFLFFIFQYYSQKE